MAEANTSSLPNDSTEFEEFRIPRQFEAWRGSNNERFGDDARDLARPHFSEDQIADMVERGELSREDGLHILTENQRKLLLARSAMDSLSR